MLVNYKKWFKPFAISVMALSVIIGSTACSVNDFQTLEKAEAKTDAAQTGVSQIELTIANDMETTGLSPDQLKIINYMKAVAYKGQYRFDKTKDQAVSESWLNLGGLGFDFTYYQDKDRHFLRYPVLKKYIDLDQMAKGQDANLQLSEETKKALGDIWSKLYTEQSVKQVEKTFVQTKEGDVKATRYDVSASGEIVKAAILESQKTIMNDPFVKERIKTAQDEAKKSGEDLQIVGLTDSFDLTHFQLSAFVDSDGYLIKEVIKMGMTVSADIGEKSGWKGTTFEMTTTYSQLGQDVGVEIPTVTQADMMTEQEMQRDMPAAFGDLIR